MKSSVTYMSKMIAAQEASLERARQDLVAKGFADQQVRKIFRPRNKDLAGEILDLLDDHGFEVVVLSFAIAHRM